MEFLAALVEKSATLRRKTSDYPKEWTELIYPVLREIGETADPPFEVYAKTLEPFLCDDERKASDGEINLIDFVYSRGSDRRNTWHPLDVVIEHENRWSFEEARKDFWKVCLYVAPLRVMIGYSGCKQEAQETGLKLTGFYALRRAGQKPR